MKALELSGIIPPLITPLRGDGSVDEDGTRRVIEHALAAGVDGVFMLGTMGEGTLLTTAQRRKVLDVASRTIRGRVPLLVAISECSLNRVRDVIASLMPTDADAFVATLPYYGSVSNRVEQIHFYQALADESPKPLVLYNIPGMAHATIEPETVAELCVHPNIVALKDSSGDLPRFYRTLRTCRKDGFRVFQAVETVAGLSLMLGADGIVSGLGSVAPAYLVALGRAAKKGEWEVVNKYQQRLIDIADVYLHGNPLSCMKAAVSLLGLCDPFPCSPNLGITPEATDQIRQILERVELLPAEPARQVSR